MSLASNIKKETLFKFYMIMAISTILNGSKCCTLTEQQKGRLEAAEISFLRAMPEY
jgi:hypothetical protein